MGSKLRVSKQSVLSIRIFRRSVELSIQRFNTSSARATNQIKNYNLVYNKESMEKHIHIVTCNYIETH